MTKVTHEQFGEGQIINSTEVFDEENNLVSCDVMFEHGIEIGVKATDLQERDKENKFKKDLFIVKKGDDDVNKMIGKKNKVAFHGRTHDDKKDYVKSMKKHGRSLLKYEEYSNPIDVEQLDEASQTCHACSKLANDATAKALESKDPKDHLEAMKKHMEAVTMHTAEMGSKKKNRKLAAHHARLASDHMGTIQDHKRAVEIANMEIPMYEETSLEEGRGRPRKDGTATEDEHNGIHAQLMKHKDLKGEDQIRGQKRSSRFTRTS